MIDVVDVTCHYGVRPVLRSLNLRIECGEVVALMGPNGTGKSTLMSVMAGTLAPLKGHVEIDGRRRRSSVENETAIRRKVAFLATDPYLPLMRTGREWLLAVGRLYGVDDERLMENVGRLLSLFDLKDREDSTIASYSTGQKKKIAVCAVLATEAPVLLLDEPFSGGLDPSGILALKRILQRITQRGGATVVMATPVPELVEELATRIIMMRDGQISTDDTLAGLRAKMGATATLCDIYGQLTDPEINQKIERYFEGTQK